MSDDNTTTDPDIGKLREQAAKSAGLEQANAAKDREIAFLKAGVDTSSLFGRTVMQSHGDKEITPEAIADTAKAVRTELGLPDPATAGDPKPKPGDPGTPEHQIQQTATALGGHSEPPGTQPPPKETALLDRINDTYHDARKHGIGEIDAQVAAIGEIFRAGSEGNVEARYDEAQFQAVAAQHGHGSEYSSLPERDYTPNVHHTKEHAQSR